MSNYTHIVFLDLDKAYDRTQRQELEILEREKCARKISKTGCGAIVCVND